MRVLKYLSPTSIMKFRENPEEFYLNYLADNRPPRMKQTQAMSIGSAFDAYIKSHLVERLFGKRPEFELRTIFEQQVEKHNWDWAWDAGRYAFGCYMLSGAVGDLMLELELSDGEPQFESTVEATIDGIPFLGKPDVFFKLKVPAHVIVDWKVNGFCSKYSKSPEKGYIICYDGWNDDHSRSHGKSHKSAQIINMHGINIAVNFPLETVSKTWALQTMIYSWTLGAPIGSEIFVGIDQLCGGKSVAGNYPPIRVARHRNLVSKEFQIETFDFIKEMWAICKSDHIFRDLSKEESQTKCTMLDNLHAAFVESKDPKEIWANKMMSERPLFKG